MLAGCRSRSALPKPGSPQYLKFTTTFYTGLAALQVGDDTRAESSLAESTKLAPGEPAAWADWGILALRQRSFEAAADRFGHAQVLAPHDARLFYLQGLLASSQGNSTAAIEAFGQAAALDLRNLRAVYQLASETERQGGPGADAHYEQLLRQILQAQPENLAALVDLARVAAKLGDAPTLQHTIAAIAQHQAGWPTEAQAQLALLQTAAQGAPRTAATRSTFLHNVLMRVPSFRDDLAVLQPAPGEAAEPFTRFLRLPTPPANPAPADTGLRFESKQFTADGARWAGAVYLNGNDAPALAWADGQALHLLNGEAVPFPGGPSGAPESVLALDYNYDFRTDLVLAGPGGLRFYTQGLENQFTDATASTKLPPALLKQPWTAAWALDWEADGDLDILLAPANGAPTLLRNNGDGTFTASEPFPGVNGLEQLAWSDLNGDGNPDAALLDRSGRLRIFLNRRSGAFTESASSFADIRAITAAGLTPGSSTLDLVAANAEARVARLSTPDEGRTWHAVPLFKAGAMPADSRLFAADLDNNGAVDLLLAPMHAPPQVWLGTDRGGFTALAAQLAPTLAVADLRNNGRLALISLGATATVQSGKNYGWQTIRPRAHTATGDQRVNPFGIGGEIEIRAGLLTERAPIATPAVHFGLGTQGEADVARILWPNGSIRAEFNLKADQQIVTEQRLKGSCPFLFAWNGQRMAFVKDSVPWGSALGLRINSLGTAAIAATEEWYKIPREQLAPRNGMYDLRVTGELWESYFYDALSLMVIDHSAGTEIYTDERFRVPAIRPAIAVTGEPQPLLRAVDDTGFDATSTLKDQDGRYLDTFGRGQYQGVTRDHWVELTLPDALPPGPLTLVAKGWLHPSDSSINVALAQGSAPKPRWLSLQVPDGRGGWHVADPNLGFPAGRNKICLFRLDNLWKPGEPHRLRLRTNLEIYWDQITWAPVLSTEPVVYTLQPARADLHYRGFSAIRQANPSSPELPDYARLAATAATWRDLPGFYTRYGDVRELLGKADDRYVIMNAGDEMSLEFAAPAPPLPGFVRDYVLAGDGWIKDGDYNSTYSASVLPYPYHARRDYHIAPTTLENDPEYRAHMQDWLTYQTRYVSSQPLLQAFR